MAPPRAVLLDLDDTILDFSGSAETTWRTVCDDAAKQISGLEPTSLLTTILDTRDWFWSDPERDREGRQDLRATSRRIVLESLRKLGFDLPDLAAAIAETYRDARAQAIRLFSGSIEALDHMRGLDIKLALLTNGNASAQQQKIDRFGLTRHFDYILIEGEFGVGKPDARVYHAAMSALGSVPSDTWMVGTTWCRTFLLLNSWAFSGCGTTQIKLACPMAVASYRTGSSNP
jgi:putative hydrolase of the HAD superfamily